MFYIWFLHATTWSPEYCPYATVLSLTLMFNGDSVCWISDSMYRRNMITLCTTSKISHIWPIHKKKPCAKLLYKSILCWIIKYTDIQFVLREVSFNYRTSGNNDVTLRTVTRSVISLRVNPFVFCIFFHQDMHFHSHVPRVWKVYIT